MRASASTADPFAEGETPTPVLAVPRLTLTWPRAFFVSLLLLAIVGGRPAAYLVVLLGLVWLAGYRAVAAAAQGLGLRYRLIDTHAFTGSHARVEVSVGNRSRWPVPLVVLEARLPEGLHGSFRRILALGPSGLRRFRFEVVALRRGAYRLGHTRVVLSDWLGLCEQRAQIAVRLDRPRHVLGCEQSVPRSSASHGRTCGSPLTGGGAGSRECRRAASGHLLGGSPAPAGTGARGDRRHAPGRVSAV